MLPMETVAMIPPTARSSAEPPLCVDLDGTLIRTDTLYESLLVLLKTNPLWAFLLPVWLARGKANFKRQIASRVVLDASTLPYHPELLAHLRRERAGARAARSAVGEERARLRSAADVAGGARAAALRVCVSRARRVQPRRVVGVRSERPPRSRRRPPACDEAQPPVCGRRAPARARVRPRTGVPRRGHRDWSVVAARVPDGPRVVHDHDHGVLVPPEARAARRRDRARAPLHGAGHRGSRRDARLAVTLAARLFALFLRQPRVRETLLRAARAARPTIAAGPRLLSCRS